MSEILFLKAHNKGYTKKSGKYVAPFDDKRPNAKPEAKPAPTAKKPSAAPKSKFKQLMDDLMAPWYGGVVMPQYGGPKFLHEDEDEFGFGFGGFSPKKPVYANAVQHPKRDEHGKPFQINEPSTATDWETWEDPAAVATFLPGGTAPDELNGIALAPWTGHPKSDEAWDYVDGQKEDLEEPAIQVPKGKHFGSGVIIEEADGRVWVVHPSNQFAGYRATFPKGHGEAGLSLQANAIKEAFEESGLQVEITGLLGDFERTTTVARYYTARRVGGTPVDCGWETQAVSLVPRDQLEAVLNRGNDRAIAAALTGNPHPEIYPSVDDWTQISHQMGSNPGGVFEDPEGVAWYVKAPKSEAIARNEVLAAALYRAVGVRVPDVKMVDMNGKPSVASRMIEGLQKAPDAIRDGQAPGAWDGFAADAWLANWDSVGLGYDNLLVDPAGNAVRIDTGGALLYRAQGEPKGAAFGDQVGEVNTLRNGTNPQAAAVFAKITRAVATKGVARIAALPDTTIRDMVLAMGPGKTPDREALADRLIARKHDLMAKFKVPAPPAA